MLVTITPFPAYAKSATDTISDLIKEGVKQIEILLADILLNFYREITYSLRKFIKNMRER